MVNRDSIIKLKGVYARCVVDCKGDTFTTGNTYKVVSVILRKREILGFYVLNHNKKEVFFNTSIYFELEKGYESIIVNSVISFLEKELEEKKKEILSDLNRIEEIYQRAMSLLKSSKNK